MIKLSEIAGLDKCSNCNGDGWVCEEHTNKPWGGISKAKNACYCGGAGQPCGVCNKDLIPKDPPDFTPRATKNGTIH